MQNLAKNQLNAVQIVVVDNDLAGQRIDNFLITKLKGVPKSHIYRIIRKGEVRVNKGRIKQTYRLKPGDKVRIPPVRLASPNAELMIGDQLKQVLETSVLYEDSHLLALNKPSGLAVHGGSGLSFGLIEAVRSLRPQVKFLELVHRLDRDTSGCILLAKRKSVLRALHMQLQYDQIDKRYLALAAGRWPTRSRRVSAPLKKNELKSGERIVRVSADGKAAETHFSVLRRFTNCTLIEAKPITGRTHQIRVHAQYIGHGLIGDEKYGDDSTNKAMHDKGIRRLFLHASSLQFTLPASGKTLKVEAPLPPDLDRALANLT